MNSNRDLYSELGVQKTASVEDIKTAFRKLALAHHPDRHSDLSEEQKTIESDRFKRISAAYQVRLQTSVYCIQFDAECPYRFLVTTTGKGNTMLIAIRDNFGT